MAKNFPYFKFIVADWLTGDIVYEDFAVQGLFVNICALYWQRDGVLTLDDINKRYKKPPELASLTDRFISVTDGKISIKFLDEQLIDARHISKTNSRNGARGGRRKQSDRLPDANRPLTDVEADLSKEKRIEKKEESTGALDPSLLESNLFRKPNIPSFEDVHRIFVQQGGTEEMAKKFFQKHEATGWYINGSPIVKIASLIANFRSNWKQISGGSNNSEKSINSFV